MPTWSLAAHVVKPVKGKEVADANGKAFDTRLVIPVSVASTEPQVFAGGSATRDYRRRWATGKFLDKLIKFVMRKGNEGVSLSGAAKEMARKEGFKRALSDQRMNFKQFVQLWPEFRIIGSGTAMKVQFVGLNPTQLGPLDAFRQ